MQQHINPRLDLDAISRICFFQQGINYGPKKETFEEIKENYKVCKI